MGLWEQYVLPPLISCACATRPIMKQRAKVVPEADGVVLEIGCGSGTNFGFYDLDKVNRLLAVEPSEGMIRRAARALQGSPLSDRTKLYPIGAEELPFEDHSVDTAVVTFVLCTIPKWQLALSEIRRVLKPTGKLLYSEHGLAPDPGVAKWQHRIEPIWMRLAGGCHLTRDARDMLTGSGFVIDRHDSMYLPNTPKIAGYAVWGAARAA